MQVTIERVRRWLVVIALAVIVLIGSVFGYARYRAHRFLARLPKQLGIDITSETNGFTWSQSVKGKTLFTIHAAKAVQRHDGKTTLHDVVIILYGRTVDEQNKERTDRIYGNEFEYDQPNGVIRAVGEVHIDLQAPGASDPHAAVAAARHSGLQDEPLDDGVIHVRTSGLVFLQKLGVAATDEPLDFHANGVDGDAHGADYDADSGVLILRKDVKFRSSRPGNESSQILADRAELDRLQHKAVFNFAQYHSQQRNLSADHLFLDLRQNGSPKHARAEGHVVVLGQEGSRIETPHAESDLTEDNKPQLLRMTNGVRYLSKTSNGESRSAEVRFNRFGRAETADLSGSVQGYETTALEKRSVSADFVKLHFTSVGKGPALLRQIKATGAARVSTAPVTTPKGSGRSSTLLSADTLVADVDGDGKFAHVTHITGDGHAAMEQTIADGGLRKSTSDRLEATLRAPASAPSTNAATKKSAKQDLPIESAIQTGNVVILDRQFAAPSRKPKSSSTSSVTESHATAARAEFDGTTDRVLLTGSPRIDSGGTNIVADRIGFNRSTGDADATGNVKGSYASEPGRDPMHVLAGSAEFHQTASSASFFGVNGGNARLWQGSSMVEAPVIDVDQKAQSLHAHTEKSEAKDSVHASLLNQQSGVPRKTSSSGNARGSAGGITRIVASDLFYRGDLPQPTAVFSGGARVQNGDGVIVSDLVTATMKPVADRSRSQAAPMLMAGAIENIVAEGAVHVQQTGRSGTGSRLTYAVPEGDFVLSGTPDAPPRVMDLQRGQITGASLLFHAGDDSVVIVAAPGKRVRAETRVKR
jgi:lipopolysaccharide export system protein LptA